MKALIYVQWASHNFQREWWTKVHFVDPEATGLLAGQQTVCGVITPPPGDCRWYLPQLPHDPEVHCCNCNKKAKKLWPTGWTAVPPPEIKRYDTIAAAQLRVEMDQPELDPSFCPGSGRVISSAPWNDHDWESEIFACPECGWKARRSLHNITYRIAARTGSWPPIKRWEGRVSMHPPGGRPARKIKALGHYTFDPATQTWQYQEGV